MLPDTGLAPATLVQERLRARISLRLAPGAASVQVTLSTRLAAALATSLGLFLSPFDVAAQALPQRDLQVELREADASQARQGAAGWSARSADASIARERPPQQLRVRNGASASLQLTLTRPLRAWQWGADFLLPPGAPGTQWLEAGQRLVVQPRWPGGRAPVSVALSAEASRFDPAVAPGSAEPPQRTAARLATTVSAELGQWVTLAATGVGDDGNVVSSGQAAASAGRVLQLRVSVLP